MDKLATAALQPALAVRALQLARLVNLDTVFKAINVPHALLELISQAKTASAALRLVPLVLALRLASLVTVDMAFKIMNVPFVQPELSSLDNNAKVPPL